MEGLRIENLEMCFAAAQKNGAEYVGVLVNMKGFKRPETIINHRKNFIKKLEYYKNSYNNDLTLKAAPNSIKITGCTYGNTFDEIEADLV